MIDRVERRARSLKLNAAYALKWAALGPFLGLGWLIGMLVRCLRLVIAAGLEGYRSGYGESTRTH